MIKLELETTEETINLLNRIMYKIVNDADNGLSPHDKDLIEKFRQKMIIPSIVNSKYPIADAFAKFFGREIQYMDDVKVRNPKRG